MKFINKKRVIFFSLLLLAVIGIIILRRSSSTEKHLDKMTVNEENMVQIDGGQFLMGSENHRFDEKPVHKVTLSSFKIDLYEITYKEYQSFLDENTEWRKDNVEIDMADLDYLQDWDGMDYPNGKENHPVVFVSWFAAKAYAEWAGKKLPTEEQWEYAGRGGQQKMDYPWGNEFRPYLSQWSGADVKGTIRVGSYTINGFGLNDMAGNVREWTADGYELYLEKEESDPLPNINNHLKVVRGGSWKSRKDELRVSARERIPPNRSLEDLGFRCVVEVSNY